MIARIMRRPDQGQTIVESRCPLIGLATDEAIELAEPGARRHAVGGARGTTFPSRGLMVLAKERSAVAVQAKHLRQWRDIVRALPCLTRKRSRRLGNGTHVVHVMIAARKK